MTRTALSPVVTWHRGVIGNAILTAHGIGGGDAAYYWNGPGSRLYLMFGDALVRIDHPAADGAYATLRDAENAVRAFVNTGSPEMAACGACGMALPHDSGDAAYCAEVTG